MRTIHTEGQVSEITESEEQVMEMIRKYTPYLEKYEKLLNRLEDEHLLDDTKLSEVRECLAQDWAALKCIAAIFTWKYTNGTWVREDKVHVCYEGKYDPVLHMTVWSDKTTWKVYLDHWDLVRTARY